MRRLFVPGRIAAGMPSWYPAVGEIVALGSTYPQSNNAQTVVLGDLVGTSGHIGDARGVFANWSGGALVYKAGLPYLFVNGGGHGDTSINGIYSFGPLTSNSPEWAVESPMTRTVVNLGDGQLWMADGKPNSNHNYNQLAAYGSDMWMVGSDGPWPSANSYDMVDRYDAATGQWDGEVGGRGQNYWQQVPRGAVHGGTVAAAGKVYYVGGQSSSGFTCVLDTSTRQWVQLDRPVLFATNVAGALDTLRNQAFFFGVNAANSVHSWQTINLGDNTIASGACANSCPDIRLAALAYDAARDRFVCPGYADRNIYELDPASKAWSTRSFTGATPAAGPLGNSGAGTTNGTYGRFRYVPELVGYIFAPDHLGPVYFYRSA